MGEKQKKQRRKELARDETARRAGAKPQEQRNAWKGSMGDFRENVEGEKIVLEVRSDEAAKPKAFAPVPASAPSKRPRREAPAQASPREEKPKAPGMRAGVKEYGEFFGIYAAYVRNPHKTTLRQGRAHEKPGTAFVPLGFIPGPAILLVFSDRDWKVQITEATSDVREELEIPTGWMEPEELPDPIYRATADWDAIYEALRYEHSAWNAGLAQRLLEVRGFIPDYLAMGMTMFRYESHPESHFGVLLVATEYKDEMELKRVYNPQGIPDVPAEGTIFPIEDLIGKDARGPVQKMIRTWATMEYNYSIRYDHRGQRRSSKPSQYARRGQPPSRNHQDSRQFLRH